VSWGVAISTGENHLYDLLPLEESYSKCRKRKVTKLKWWTVQVDKRRDKKTMILLSVTTIVILAIYIFIGYKESKNVNLLKSAKFVFFIGLISTLFGFVLATYTTDLIKERDNNKKAIGLLEASIRSDKSEMKFIGVKIGLLEAYLNGKIEKPVLYSIAVDSNTIDLFTGNADIYANFSDSFKVNLPKMNSSLKILYQTYDSKGIEEKDLVVLKEIAGLKYLTAVLMEEELNYLQGEVKANQHQESIERIVSDEVSSILMKSLENRPYDEIVPNEFVRN
jgi:hypothetical protein